MEEINNDIDPDNDVAYGISNRGNEVIIINEREIFQKQNCGKRTLNNNYTIILIKSISSNIRFKSLSTNISKRRRITINE